jgi:hypothetical protein
MLTLPTKPYLIYLGLAVQNSFHYFSLLGIYCLLNNSLKICQLQAYLLAKSY